MGSALFLSIILGVLAVALHIWWFARKTRGIAQFAETMVPPTGKFVTAGGRRFHVEDRGRGRPVVFIHGLGGNLHHFDIPLWPSMGQGYRLIAIDRRGSGYSAQDWGNDGAVTTHARDIAAILDELGVENALYVGHSLGGAVALAAALTTPEKVAGLALIAPLTVYNPEVAPQFRPLHVRSPRLRKFLVHTYAIPAAVKATEATLDFVFGPQRPPEDFAVGGAALTGVRPQHFYAASTDLVSIERDMPQIEARVGEIRVPTAVLFGTADRVLDYRRNGLSMERRLPGCEVRLLDGVGHMVQYAAPDATANFVKAMAARALPA